MDSSAERQVLEDIIARLGLPRSFFTPETKIVDALPLILQTIIWRLESLDRRLDDDD